ncbi:MAG: hypothetical protein A2X86_03950 [Bdellovibrionales bacterium GWA2_49_15]|nr:MAG: hypothetical protein A2X86_03950 [Bdellovibrionales bacterium GWA2_49_15]HAZ12370.1 hypothetical protein [Bdellovibrionales bacterium]
MWQFFIGLFLLSLSCLTRAAVSEVALSDHALRLAILKYNSSHTKPLSADGPHHRMMMDFLRETLKRFPELADLPFYAAENRYLQLSLTLASDGTSKRDQEIQKILRVANRLGKNCPYELSTNSIESHLSSRVQSTNSTTKKAILGMTLSPSGARCQHPLIARAQQLGLHELELRQFHEGKKHVVTMSLNSPFAQDLEYVAKALLETGEAVNAEEKAIIEAMVPAPLGRQNDYYESLIVHRPAAENSNDIDVEFIDRWERSGVLYTHHYFIRGTSVSDSDRAFKIELVREWGPTRSK